MISTWRRRMAARRARKLEVRSGDEAYEEVELTVPSEFKCPISLDLMKDPVTLSSGITYDRESIETWIEAGNRTCPITNRALGSLEPVPNHMIRRMIQDWCVENRSHGIERIPTPRIPVSSMEVAEMLAKISEASKVKDQSVCRKQVVKIKALTKESERNKKCFKSNGTGSILAAAFEAFSETSSPDEENDAVLKEILSALTLLLPLGVEAKSCLGSPSSLRCMVGFLTSGDLSSRWNSALALREIVSSDKRKIEALAEIEGASKSLFKLVKEPICPAATKSSLIVIYHMVTSSHPAKDAIISRFVQMGLVSLLVETLVDADRSTSEKALGVLDGICDNEEGKEAVRDNSLAVPVLVKKLLRVSDLATEFSVSVLWKLMAICESGEDGGGVLAEALLVGAFQKLLLLLQVGCGETTKEKATQVVKLLNLHRERLECIDSLDFKDLKRPF
ncbi:U-box domain-containing protein 21-like [Syzygium oleosum]|uniref:U-box domain-containing protein 21-like n=1 Tax=Syzygium oleosum TaxID=219896 RepID=UPI0011D2BDB6|nr:U-box domain-containing protein 21-like [Syzygium oleosum]